MSELREMIGTRIRAMRNAKGLTQQKLADIAGLDYRYIGALERGERNFSIDTLEKVTVALDISISELILSSDTIHSGVRQEALDEFLIVLNMLSDEKVKALLTLNRQLLLLI